MEQTKKYESINMQQTWNQFHVIRKCMDVKTNGMKKNKNKHIVNGILLVIS